MHIISNTFSYNNVWYPHTPGVLTPLSGHVFNSQPKVQDCNVFVTTRLQ